jgi:hypothetical protein
VPELADVVRAAGPAYVRRFGDRMLPSHHRVLRDLANCRTPVLGGEMFVCSSCGHRHAVYHSCRNRHCPKCQGDRAEQWLAAQRRLLLPTEYAFATCTLPAGLRELAISHQQTVYSILIHEAAHALLDVASNRTFIGGLTGIMAVLHTWTRALIYHPHVHLLFPIGGLDGDTWKRSRKRRYALPQSAFAKRFRERVELAFRRRGLYGLTPREAWCRQPWVAHVKRVGSGEQALLYLSRYMFRVAISNRRILAFDGEKVTFSETRQSGEFVRHTLTAEDFLQRFLQHVLPRGFVKVRYYGLWAPTNRAQLARAREILEHHLEAIGKPLPVRDAAEAEPGRTCRRCPQCGAPYQDPPTEIPRSRAPP